MEPQTVTFERSGTYVVTVDTGTLRTVPVSGGPHTPNVGASTPTGVWDEPIPYVPTSRTGGDAEAAQTAPRPARDKARYRGRHRR